MSAIKTRNENFFPVADKSFKWVDIPNLPSDLEAVMVNGKRFYVIEGPDGTQERLYFPSITTLLGQRPKPALEAWKKRLGPEEAERQAKKAANRGTGVHSTTEAYLLNEDNYGTKATGGQISLFQSIKKYLNNIDNVVGLELPLYSRTFGLAGRCDCIAEYNGVPSIIDFKTSKKPKKKEWIEDYFIQASFYSFAFEELTGYKITNIVIIIANEDGTSDVFTEKRAEWLKELWKINKTYKPNLVYSL